MTSAGILWGMPRQPYVKVILSIAALNGQELEQPEFDMKNKPAAFLSKFPYGKIPAFEASDGFKLIEGVSIARYLSAQGSVNLLGTDAKEIALIDQWIHFAESEIGGAVRNIFGMIFGFSGPFNREQLDKYYDNLDRALRHVESHLSTSSSGYLVSNYLTLADLNLAGMVFGASYGALGVAERAKYPNLLAHYSKVTADEKIKQYWGTESFSEVRITEQKDTFP